MRKADREVRPILIDGQEIEPVASVDVRIEYANAVSIDDGQELNVVHFAKTGTETMRGVSISDDNTEIMYKQGSFSVTGTIVSSPSGTNYYMVLVKRTVDGEDAYYIVNNDGSLTLVRYENGKVYVEDPMLWTYTGTNLYFHSIQVGFNSSQIASDYYNRYIDPSVVDALSEDDSTNCTVVQGADGLVVQSGSRTMMTQSALSYTDGHLVSANNSNYYIGVSEEDGTLVLCGQSSSDEAAEIVFARASEVASPSWIYHSVNHIDIAIEGSTSVDVPLAYGKYYDSEGYEILSVSSNKTLTLTKSHVGITTDDMKGATITAYTKDSNGVATELDNAFYVTGYSANDSTDYTDTNQVRIEGSFKVANLDWTVDSSKYNGEFDWNTWSWNYDYRDYVNAQRLANKIYYSVTAIKSITFDLVDPDLGQLYDADGNKLTITVDVAFSASFDYFNADNECPPVQWELQDVLNGLICTHDTSGMDFRLGGDADDANSQIVAVEITKMIVDENGNRIKPSSSTTIKISHKTYSYQQ